MMPKQVAIRMMDSNSFERKEAEKMMGVPFEKMTIEQRRLSAACVSAFYETIKKRYDRSKEA